MQIWNQLIRVRVCPAASREQRPSPGVFNAYPCMPLQFNACRCTTTPRTVEHASYA